MGATIILTPTQAPVTIVSNPHAAQKTLWDVVEAMTLYLGSDPGENAHRDIKLSLEESRIEFQGIRWTYLNAQGRLFLQGMQTDGTVEYDHTGGAYERLLTLTDGTWPDWVVYGFLRIEPNSYTVARKLSATELQLDAVLNPGQDIDAGTTYTLGLDTYTLPADFVAGHGGMPEGNWGGLDYITPAAWAAASRYVQCFSRPAAYTFRGDPRTKGRIAVSFVPCPDQAQALDYTYRRKMQEFTTWDYSTGKITVTSAPTRQVVITGGSFKAFMVGDIIRLSENARDLPTGPEGLTPYVVERTITGIVDSSTALVDEDIADNYQSVAFRISSPIDVEEAQRNAFNACVRKRLDRHRRADTIKATEAQWTQEREKALEDDQRDAEMRVAGQGAGSRFSIKDMPLGPEVG